MAFNISYRFQVLDGFSVKIKKFQKGLKKLAPTMREVSRKVGQGFKNMSAGIDRARNSMLVFSAGIVAFGFTAFNSIIEFQRGMNALKAVTKASDDQMKSMRATARGLGRDTAFTAGQAANAMAVLGLAGFKTEQIIGTIPAVLSLAAAGAMPIDEAAGIMTSAMKSFQLDISDAIRITDILAVASSNAKTSVSQMGQALSGVGATALTSGIDIETTSAILAVLQDRAIGPAMAGTGLRGVINKLHKPTKEAKDGFKSLGVNIKEVKRLMKDGDILAVFELLNKGFAGLDKGGMITKNAAAMQIFGLETANVALTFASAMEDVKKMVALLRNLNDDTKKMAEARLAGLPGAVLLAKSAFESLQLAIGDAGLTKRLIQFADFIKNASNYLEKINPNIKAFAVDVGIAFVAITAVLVPLAALATLFGGVAFAVGAASTATLAVFTAGVILLTTSLINLAKSWKNVSAAFSERGIFGALGAFFGSKIETNIINQRATSLNIEENLKLALAMKDKRDNLNRASSQKNLTGRAPAANVNLNGNISVSAQSGASVDSAEISVLGAGGKVGSNLAAGAS